MERRLTFAELVPNPAKPHPRKCVYLIGSLRNPRIPEVANAIEAATGYEVFASWFAAGEHADDAWRDYERARGNKGIREALKGYAAQHVFKFDKEHLDRADGVVLVMPGGKSAFTELGYAAGKEKPCFILFDEEPERYDVMMNFATDVTFSVAEVALMLKRRLG